MRRAALVRMGLAAAVAVVPACGFSEVLDKRDTAGRIEDAFDRAQEVGVATGRTELSVTLVKSRAPLAGVKDGFTTPTRSLPMTIDVKQARSFTEVDVQGQRRPLQAYDESVLFQYAGTSGRSRPWIAYNMQRTYEKREQHDGEGFGSSLLNPAYLFQLLPGVLTGSIENLGEEEVAGVPTTHFRANFDAKRATEDARQERRESIETALELMSVTKRDAIKGDVWIDAEGVPRKVRMELRQKFTRRDIISVNVAAVLEQVRTEGEVTVPARDQAARTDELGAIARGLQGILSQLASQLGGATAGAGQPGAPPTDVPPTDAPATDAPAPASGTAP